MRGLQKHIAIFVAVLACASSAQLAVSKKSASDSIRLDDKKPLVLAPESQSARIQALDDSVSTVNAGTTLGEDARNVAIMKGLEIVGEVLKESLSPNSAEADAAERALDYR